MKSWKPWEFLHNRDQEENDDLRDMINFSNSNPLPATFERYDNQKHSAHERRQTAALHPEDQN